MGKGAPPSQASDTAIWTKAAGAVEGGLHRANSQSEGDTPGGMLNRVDVGALPSNRWYG